MRAARNAAQSRASASSRSSRTVHLLPPVPSLRRGGRSPALPAAWMVPLSASSSNLNVDMTRRRDGDRRSIHKPRRGRAALIAFRRPAERREHPRRIEDVAARPFRPLALDHADDRDGVEIAESGRVGVQQVNALGLARGSKSVLNPAAESGGVVDSRHAGPPCDPCADASDRERRRSPSRPAGSRSPASGPRVLREKTPGPELFEPGGASVERQQLLRRPRTAVAPAGPLRRR